MAKIQYRRRKESAGRAGSIAGCNGSSAGQPRIAPGNVQTSGGPGGNFRSSTVPVQFVLAMGFGDTLAEASSNAFAQEPGELTLPADPPAQGCD